MRLNRLAVTCLLALACSAPLPGARSLRHALAMERCGWAVDATLEDYGPVGILRHPEGHPGCLVWFTPDGTGPDRYHVTDEKPLRVVKLPHEELPAVLFRKRRWPTDSADRPDLQLVLIRPGVNAQELDLVAPSPRRRLVGPTGGCHRVSVRAHLCPAQLWTEEHACEGEAAVHRFRRWEPNQPSAYHVQEQRPECATGPGELWFEADAAAPLRAAIEPGSPLPAPEQPPAVESAALLALYAPRGWASNHVSALAAFDVRRPDLDGGVERDVDLHVRLVKAQQWSRYASVTLERGAPESGCEAVVSLDEDGAASVVSCVDGRRVETSVRLPLPPEPPEPGCQTTPAGRVCLETASDSTAVGWLLEGPFSTPRGIPAIRRLRLVDGPFFEGDHLRFVGHDVAAPGQPLRWVRAPLPKGPTDLVGVRQLEPTLATGGFTTGVTRLKQGAVLVTRASCSEGGSSLAGVFLFPSAPPLRVDSGPALDLGRYAVLDTVVGIGSDESGELPSLPRGATFYEHSSNGSYFVKRVIAVDLQTRSQREQPWGSHSPRTAGERRFVVFAKSLDVAGSRHEVYAWDVAGGPAQLVGVARRAFNARVVKDEVWVELETGVFAVNGTTGASRRVPSMRGVLPDAPAFSPPLPPVGAAPPFWQTPTGEAVIVQGGVAGQRPEGGGCGNPGFQWVYGTLIADQGVFVWPKDLRLIDFEVPRTSRSESRP